MMEQYRAYVQTHPLQGWLIAVSVGLALCRVLTWAMPDLGKHGPPFFLILACVAVSSPTVHLMMRLSEEGRREGPIPPEQERGIAALSLAAGVCALGALAVGAAGRWAGWPLDTRVDLLSASFLAAAVAAALGYGVRQTRAGRWGVGLSVAWGPLLVVYIVVRLLWRTAGHA